MTENRYEKHCPCTVSELREFRKLGEIELEQLVHRTGFEEQVGVEAGQRSSHGGLVLEQADGAR